MAAAAAPAATAAGKNRHWCFTLNNPLSVDCSDFFKDGNGAPLYTYLVFQQEQAPGTGTRHLQGYVEFPNPRALAGVKRILPSAHWEQRRGTREQARAYCMKAESRFPDTEPIEYGEFVPSQQGARTDLEALRDLIKQGATKRQLLEEHPQAVAKFPRFIDDCFNTYRNDMADKISIQEFRPWQQQCMDFYKDHQDKVEGYNRSIYWIYDERGNNGKTYLATHLVDQEKAFYTNGGKSSDVVFAYNSQPIVIFDFVREKSDYVQYGTIEQLKNGILYSSKYQGTMKRFNSPFVIVFANFPPDSKKMSKDRLKVYTIEDNTLMPYAPEENPFLP